MEKVTRFLKGIPKFLALSLINFYRACISPHFPCCCRFIPSCSEYGKQAIEKYGVIKGVKLTFKRLIKCHPGGPSGYDPVP